MSHALYELLVYKCIHQIVFQDSVDKTAKKIQENISNVVEKIKLNENIRGKDMEKHYQILLDQINKELANVKSKVRKTFK